MDAETTFDPRVPHKPYNYFSHNGETAFTDFPNTREHCQCPKCKEYRVEHDLQSQEEKDASKQGVEA